MTYTSQGTYRVDEQGRAKLGMSNVARQHVIKKALLINKRQVEAIVIGKERRDKLRYQSITCDPRPGTSMHFDGTVLQGTQLKALQTSRRCLTFSRLLRSTLLQQKVTTSKEFDHVQRVDGKADSSINFHGLYFGPGADVSEV